MKNLKTTKDIKNPLKLVLRSFLKIINDFFRQNPKNVHEANFRVEIFVTDERT